MLGRALSTPPLRWIGSISYGLYLWHWPVYVVCAPDRMGIDGTALLLARIAITFAFAVSSYYLVEQPIRRGALRRQAWVVAPAAVVAVVVLVVATTAGGRPTLAETAADARRSAPVTAPPTGTDGVPTRVLVVGDSIALSLAEGIRGEFAAHGVTVLDEGMLGCGIVSTGKVWIAGEMETISPKCADWAERWGRAEADFAPDVVVVLVGAWDAYDREIDGRFIPFDTPESDALLRADLSHAVDVLSSGGARVVLLTVPYYEYRYSVNTPDVSRSAFVPARVDHFNEILAGVAAADERVTLIDLNHFLSPDGAIHATIDGIAVQGDGVHFSPEGGQYVAEWLQPKLARLAVRSG
jgi:lysophospholipase L1-like esterase